MKPLTLIILLVLMNLNLFAQKDSLKIDLSKIAFFNENGLNSNYLMLFDKNLIKTANRFDQDKTLIYPVSVMPVILNFSNGKTVPDTLWKGQIINLSNKTTIDFKIPLNSLATPGDQVCLLSTAEEYHFIRHFVGTNGWELRNTQLFNFYENLTPFSFTVDSSPRKALLYYMSLFDWDNESYLKGVFDEAEKVIDLSKRSDSTQILKMLNKHPNPRGKRTLSSIPVIQTTYELFVQSGNLIKRREIHPIRNSLITDSTFVEINENHK